MRRPINKEATMAEAPKRIWAAIDEVWKAEGDGTPAIYASGKSRHGLTEYVRADLYEEAMKLAELAVSAMGDADG